MNELFAQLFGQQPGYASELLGEEEARRLQQRAQQQGLLNLGLSLLSGSGPSAQPRGIGQLLAQGVQAGQQAYQGAYNKALQEQMLKQQFQQQQQAQREQQAAQQLLPQILRPGAQTPTFYGQPTQMPLRDDEGNIMPGAGVSVGQPQIDLNTLQQLLTRAPSVAGKVLPTVEAFRKMTAPERVTLKEGEQVFEMTPEGPRAIAGVPKTEKPERPPTSIQEYQFAVDRGYKGSFEDFKRLGASTTNINMPTGEERKAAVLANRLNFGVQQMNEAIGREPTAAMPNTAAEAARFFTRSDFIANTITPAQRQVVETAQLDVLDAALTLGTGAAYTREQLEGYRKSYFPQMGDDAATIKSKQQRLENLLKSAQIASGRASADIPTPIPKPITPQAQEASPAPALPSGVRVRKKDGA